MIAAVSLVAFVINELTCDRPLIAPCRRRSGRFVAPVLVYLLIPESPRWYLRRGNPEAAVEAVNRIISRCGRRIEPLTVAALGEKLALAREALPSFTASPSACSPPDRDTAGAPSPRSRANIQRRHEPD